MAVLVFIIVDIVADVAIVLFLHLLGHDRGCGDRPDA